MYTQSGINSSKSNKCVSKVLLLESFITLTFAFSPPQFCAKKNNSIEILNE